MVHAFSCTTNSVNVPHVYHMHANTSRNETYTSVTYGHEKRPLKSDLYVIRMRLERMTVCLEGRCSIQLSYRTIIPLIHCLQH